MKPPVEWYEHTKTVVVTVGTYSYHEQ